MSDSDNPEGMDSPLAHFAAGMAQVVAEDGEVVPFVTIAAADGNGGQVLMMTEPERASAMVSLLLAAIDMTGWEDTRFALVESEAEGPRVMTPVEVLREQLRAAPRDPSTVAAFDQFASGLRDAAMRAGLGDPIPDDVALGIMWGVATVLALMTAPGVDVETAVYVVSRFAAGD